MRVARVVAGLTVVITTVLGLSLATAGPAAAASGTWRSFGNTNPIASSESTWRCGATANFTSGVSAQACAIRASNGLSVQAAVIVHNRRSSLYSTAAAMDLFTGNDRLGNWVCSQSGVGANSWSVCFGDTRPESRPVNSVGAVTGADLEQSPDV
jgi:hypothetical protein